MKQVTEVKLWGSTIGAVSLEPDRDIAAFQYDSLYARSGIELSPITMPLSNRVYTFPTLRRQTFYGLPGLLADTLPDRFGNALIDAWLAREGRSPESFSALERLCYVGSRGMGALEFSPSLGPKPGPSRRVAVDALVELASRVLSERRGLTISVTQDAEEDGLEQLLRVGTSAGGARAKAVIAWNPATGEVRSGQIDAETPFEYWLIKFDGVNENRDKELADPRGFGAIEFAYSQMAAAAGITMSECHLLEENGRRHFMTKRFDRTEDGRKLHMQSLGAIAHLDFNAAGAHAYEEALLTIRRLGLPMRAIEEQFRRLVFNVLARNQDDHVKNIAFLMDKTGRWSLSPAYDVTFAYNPTGDWTATHQMTVNGKRDHFTIDDLRACAKSTSIKRGRAEAIYEQVRTAVLRWSEFAHGVHVEDLWVAQIGEALRTELPRT